jgi:hypothetical protein
MNNQTTQFDSTKMFETIGHYETYYKGKRSEKQKYIMCRAIKFFVEDNGLENPNQYLLYLIADKALNVSQYKTESSLTSTIQEELQKDIQIFKPLNK